MENLDFSKYYIGNDEFDQNIYDEIANKMTDFYKNSTDRSTLKNPSNFFSRKWNETTRNSRKGTFMDDGSPLGSVKFEVEIKKMVGLNENSTLKKAVFTADDFDWTVPYRPTIDITKHIKVKGDFFSEDVDDDRTITTFRMFADYESLVKGVFDGTIAYFDGFRKSGGKYSVAQEKCGEFDLY